MQAVRSRLEYKVNVPAREVVGYAATYDPDDVGDKILPGAFAECLKFRHEDPIKEKGRSDIRVLWQHDQPIGVLLEAREDEKGLWIKARISRTALGDDVLQLLADGAVDRMSIGYMVPSGGSTQGAGGLRVIRNIDLWEVSFVTFPANPRAVVDGVKEAPGALTLELKARRTSVSWGKSEEETDMSVHWETKAGRAIAGRNAERLKAILGHCKGMVEHCSKMLEEAGHPLPFKFVDTDLDGKAVTENPDNDFDRDDNAGGRGKPPSNHDVARDARAGKGDVPHQGQPVPHPESVAGLVPGLGQPTPTPESIANAYPGPYTVPTPVPESVASSTAGGGFRNDQAGYDQGKIPAIVPPVYTEADPGGDSKEDLQALAEGRPRVSGHSWDAYVAAPMPTPGVRPGGSGPYPTPVPQPYSVAGQTGPSGAKESPNGSSYDSDLIRQLQLKALSLANMVEK